MHFGARCPDYLVDNAKDAMLTVGSTSPSYLVLASLDNANQLLADPDFYANEDSTSDVIAEHAKLKQRIEKAEIEWLELNEELEAEMARQAAGG